MTKTQFAVESMASDLKRICLGLQRNSMTMVNRFSDEVKKRNLEINQPLHGYINKIIKLSINLDINNENKLQVAENCLMYSTLLQNFSKSG